MEDFDYQSSPILKRLKKKIIQKFGIKKEWHRIPSFFEINKGTIVFLKRERCYRSAHMCG